MFDSHMPCNFHKKSRSEVRVGSLLTQKRNGFTSSTFEITRHAIFKKKLGVDSLRLQKSYSKTGNREVQAHCACKKMNLPCVHSTLTRHPIFTKKVKWMAGLALLTNKYLIHLIYAWLLHAIQFSQNKTNLRGRWACCACKKILHSPYLHLPLTCHATF